MDGELAHDGLARACRGGDQDAAPRLQGLARLDLEVVELESEQLAELAELAAVDLGTAPVAASVDDGIYFTVAPQSVLARNLAGNSRIAFTICDSVHAVMGQGVAVRVGPALELGTLIDDLATASRAGRFTPDGWDGDIYQIGIRRIFAN